MQTIRIILPFIMKYLRFNRLQIFGLLCCCLAFWSCGPQPAARTAGMSDTTGNVIRHARGFRLVRHADHTEISVRDPWDTLRVMQHLLLYRNSIPPHDAGDICIQVPVKRTACLFGTDVCMLRALDVAGTLTAVAEPEYISDSLVQTMLRQKKITPLGQASRINLEALIMSAPDILIVSPFDGSDYSNVEPTGIPVIQCVSYMENTPLGRAEWIRFLAAFYDKEDEGDAFFNALETRYAETAALASGLAERPTVFSEMKNGQTWSVPGGGSYMSCFFRDAGLDYLWKERPETGSLMFSFETVYNRAEKADYWIIKYHLNGEELTYSRLAAEYEPYTYFKAFRDRRIIVCNTAVRPYFEQGVLEPDVVLADLMHLTHPGLAPDYTPVYFEMMKE